MTNRERYKQAFSTLRASDNIILEAAKMKNMAKRFRLRKTLAIAAVCIMLMACAGVAYAADVGGIQRSVQLWIHGDLTAATIEFDGAGHYSMDYTDDGGNTHTVSGGGVAFGPDGTEIPVSEEELMEEITAPQVSYEDDGSVWLYWFDQSLDITDKFKDGVCYIQLKNGDETLYLTIKYNNGYASSTHKFISPTEFN